MAECATCGQSYGSYGAHNMVDGACSICGKEESQGLEYELSSNGTYYVVIGIGTCTDTDLVIPLAYNNLPLKEIGAHAFYNCTSLTSIKYRGTEEQWQAISKRYDWDYDTGNYTITYNYQGE